MAIFDIEFQKQVVALYLKDSYFGKMMTGTLSPNHFDNAYLSGVIEELNSFVEEFSNVPSMATIRQLCFNRAKIRKEKFDLYEDILNFSIVVSDTDLEYTREHINAFLKAQSLRQALLKSADHLNSGTGIEKIGEEIDAALQIGFDAEDTGYDYLENLEERLSMPVDEHELVVPTGVKKLDECINGGLRSQELGIIVGASSGGKSAMLARIAANCLRSASNVFLYSLEMKDNRIANRIDSILSSVPMKETWKDSDAVVNQIKKFRNIGSRLIIKSYPRKEATVSMLRDYTERLRMIKGISPDLIVVDYAGEIRPIRNVSAGWEGEEEIFSSLCAWAQRLDLPIWTATQVNRNAMNKGKVNMQDVAGSIEKIFKADVAIAICQTQKEEIKNRIRLYVMKNRDGAKGAVITCSVDWKRMRIKPIDFASDVDPKQVEYA